MKCLLVASLVYAASAAPAGPPAPYGPQPPPQAYGPDPAYYEEEAPIYRRQDEPTEYQRQGYEEQEAPVYKRQAAYPQPPRYVEEEEPPKPYAYEYGVKDEYSGAAFTKSEIQNEVGAVQGSYKVHLPDGRIQTVTYHADAEGGFVADVSYEGTPQYPEEPVGGYGRPKHRPPPGAYPNRLRA